LIFLLTTELQRKIYTMFLTSQTVGKIALLQTVFFGGFIHWGNDCDKGKKSEIN